MREYTINTAWYLILDGLRKAPHRDEYDICLVEYELDIAEEMYYSARYQTTFVYPTITV